MQHLHRLRSHCFVSFVLMSLAAVSFAPQAPAQVGLGLIPMRVEVPLQPSASYTDSLELTSESPIATHVKGEILDFSIDNDENPQFGVFPDSVNSCSSFVRISPREFDMTPKQQRLIRYTVSAPADLKPGSYHCAVGFTTQPVPDQKQAGLSINVRVVSSFYFNVGNPTYKNEVQALALDTDPSAPAKTIRAFCILKNSGDYILRPVGGLDVLSPDGVVEDHVALRSLPVFPHNTQRFLLPLKNKPKEGEVLRLRMDVGNGEIEEARAVVSQSMLAR